uniref:dolichyl-phosphate-mannose--protein mannosyltransferase n=1 Tax=Parastrongyloides trichosuri TaxID=131310 RepID=A0A0N4Z4T6_PARTI
MTNYSSNLTIFTLAILSFIFSYNGEFVFDDHRAIVKNPVVTAPLNNGLNINQILKTDFWGTLILSPESHKSYRPIPTLIFRIIYLINRLDTKLFHLTNILIHGFNSILIPYTLKVWMPQLSSKAIFYIATIFATHPIHGDAVASIVGLTELLMTFFFLLAMNETIKNEQFVTKKYILFVLLSLFCKEQGIMILPLSIFINIMRNDKRITQKSITLSIMTVAMIIVRLSINNFEEPKFSYLDNPPSFTKSLFSKVSTQLYIYLLNIKLLLWPWHLSIDYSMGSIPLIETTNDIRFICLSLFFIIIVLGMGKISKMELSTNEQMILVNGIILSLFTFLPSSNIFFRVGFVIAERVLYLPSLGFSIILGYGIIKYENNFSKYFNTKVFFKALILILLTKSIQRSGEWLSEEEIYKSSIMTCPRNAKLYYNLGKIYSKNNNYPDAIEKYRMAIKLHPEYNHAMNNLANIYESMGEYLLAEELLKKSISIDSSFGIGYMNLGIVQMKMGKYNESEKNLIKNIMLRPENGDGLFNLGNLYINMKMYEEARDAYINATRIDKNHIPSWINLLILLEDQFNCNGIEIHVTNVLKDNNDKGIIHHQIASCFFKTNNYMKAKYHFEKAVELENNNKMFRKNLKIFYKYINFKEGN